MSIKKVLWLDVPYRASQWMHRVRGWEYETPPWLTTEYDFAVERQFYQPYAHSVEKLAEYVAQQPQGGVGQVVIGNNNGGGVKIAERIANEISSGKIVIVWNQEPEDYDTRKYRNLGFTHFTSRCGLKDFLPRAFADV